MGVFEKNKGSQSQAPKAAEGQKQTAPETTTEGQKSSEAQGAGEGEPKAAEGLSATPADGPGDQGHGEGDSKLTALEQAQAIQSADQGSQARGVVTVNDPNPHERFDAQGVRTNTRYQSDAAREALLNPDDANRINEKGIVDAEIGSGTPEAQQATDLEALNKKVIVKPRQTVNRFRIGETWYSLKENVETLVPQHVAIILAEKGIT